MISIHTNLSSLVVQNNLSKSTNGINPAIERMSTGYKINHAADNVSNFSISRNMSTQLSACDVAADNIAMGMDLLSVAQDTIAGMQSRGSRIHALITQARNGTYGADSLNAMTQEVNALVSEINRLYANTEYNGIKLFDNVELPDWAQEMKSAAAANNGFIAEVDTDTPDVVVTDPTQLASAISGNTKIGIGNAQTLAKLAELVNSGRTCEGKTIILTEDIDLSAYQEGEGWTPIGRYNLGNGRFQGTFNGNGHKITGLYINRPDSDKQGLFGEGSVSSIIKNVALEDVNVTGQDWTGGLVGSFNGIVSNCYVTGQVNGCNSTGGLAGSSGKGVTNCYADVNVTGNDKTGGLVGRAQQGAITNSYATGNVSGNECVGGLIGQCSRLSGTVIHENILSSGSVSGSSKVGSLIGGIVNTSDGTSFSTITFTNVSARAGGNMIGFEGGSDGTAYSSGQMESWLENITAIKSPETTLQVGINGGSDSQISVDTNLSLNLSIANLTSDGAYNSITNFLNRLSEKSTELGAAQNRLESALESNLVMMDNLTSSLSTIRDADISEVSSDYIRQQILQQACATLMSTANQSPAIALQLL